MLLTIMLWLCALYFLLPLFWLLIASTKDNSDLFSTFGLWFGQRFSLWDNLVSVFTVRDGLYVRWALNTVLYAGVSAIGASLVATMAGYGFAKYSFPGSRSLFSITLGAMLHERPFAGRTFRVRNAYAGRGRSPELMP
jgi:multiple sugar transport system permease protein